MPASKAERKSSLARTREARTRKQEHEPAAEKPGRGRPRNAERHAAILEATRELVLEVGYARVSIDAVAKRSGASRTTIYEWWGHRAPLVEEAIFQDYGEWAVPDTGTFEEDLAALIEEFVSEMTRPHVARAFPALSAEFQSDPELKTHVRTAYGQPMQDRWEAVFDRARRRREIGPDVNAEAAMQLTLGAVLMMTQSRVLPRKQLAPYLLNVLCQGYARGVG